MSGALAKLRRTPDKPAHHSARDALGSSFNLPLKASSVQCGYSEYFLPIFNITTGENAFNMKLCSLKFTWSNVTNTGKYFLKARIIFP